MPSTKRVRTTSRLRRAARPLAAAGTAALMGLSIALPAANADQWVGAHQVKGQIEVAYFATSGPARWGYPVTDELPDRRGGRFQKFERQTSFYWNPFVDGGNAHQVGGAIEVKWGTTGWETGPLGYPVADEAAVSSKGPWAVWNRGAYSRFQGGLVYWGPRSGTQIVWGLIREAWEAADGPNGMYGYPTSAERYVAGHWEQTFQGGVVKV